MPEGLRNYKKREKLFYVRLVAGTKAFFGGFVSIPRRIAAWLGAKTTIVFIPHSEAPSRRFGISRFLLGLAGISFIALVGFSFFAATRYTAVRIQLRIAQGRAAEASAAVDELRDGAETLMGSALRFESKLAELLAVGAPGDLKQLAVPAEQALKAAGLASLLSMPASQGMAFREVERLSALSAYLDSAVPGLERIANTVAAQKDIMSEIPNIWPIQGGLGHISMYFGQNEHPFSAGQWYLHTGIDISTYRSGDPILATADGKVIDASYTAELGNSVTIQHSHGFITRYGHLRSIRIKKGQQVAQGQVIGTLGNTGKSTGPHLHYEVHLGTSIIDPLRFLNVRKAVK
ncbi:MAG: M23 family metallopeptidase [Spirochaetales bacterium]|nr:M23 family metallopeptidase [Spirochaetales bacterium]